VRADERLVEVERVADEVAVDVLVGELACLAVGVEEDFVSVDLLVTAGVVLVGDVAVRADV
jgi:hypothetical protein